MRTQYHFRDSPRGRLAWDVHRLIELASDLPRRRIPLEEIRELDEPYWFADEEARPTCRSVAHHARLIREASLHHPIILSADGRVMDGMHRVAKALIQNRETVLAVRFSETPEPDYVDVDPAELPYDEG